MLRRKNSVPFILLGILPAIMLILYGYIGSFARYLADDYCSMFYAKKFSFFRSIWYWYINWSGRFSAYAVDWFVTRMGTRAVQFVPPVTLAFWLFVTVLAVYLFLRQKFPGDNTFRMSLTLGIVFIFSMLLLSPNIQQSFFWWSGMRQYTLSLIMLTLFAVLYELSIEKLTSRRALILGAVFSFLFLFANAGLDDTFAVSQFCLLGILVLLLVIFPKRGSAHLAILSAGLAGTALAVILIVLSPGNANREAYFPPHPGLVKLLMIASQGYAGFLQSLVSAPEKALGLIGAILVAFWVGGRTDHRLVIKPWVLPAFILFGILLSFGAVVPGSFGLSEPPPTRTLIISVFMLTSGLLIAAFLSGNRLLAGASSNRTALVLLVLAVLTINLTAAINIQKEYLGRDVYITYAGNSDAVEARILEAKAAGQTSVIVPALQNWAGLDILSDNPKNWLNTCATGYYGIKIIGYTP